MDKEIDFRLEENTRLWHLANQQRINAVTYEGAFHFMTVCDKLTDEWKRLIDEKEGF